jgi:DNA topoisomerase IA
MQNPCPSSQSLGTGDAAQVAYTALARQRAETKPPSSKPFARRCAPPNGVWLATDCDREGQLIGQEILDHYELGVDGATSAPALRFRDLFVSRPD